MNDEQLLRYSRQILLPQIDIAGQERLLASHVMVVGLGGLGSPVAIYLAAAGVGRLTLVDHDLVDLSNLQRQIIHTQRSIGHAKVDSAAETLRALNPDTVVHALAARIDAKGLDARLPGIDLVVDGTDNFATRYLINDACFRHGVPFVSGAAIRMEGQVAVFDPRDPESPCYRCLYPDGDDAALNCSENGVAAPVVGIIGSVQALEALKLITGAGETLTGAVLYFDGIAMDWQRLRLRRRRDCPVHPTGQA
jgi:molybdopterin/thiamine biosynthesis adenylyltransferase